MPERGKIVSVTPVEERVATLESQVAGISKQDDKMDRKMDALMDLVNGIKDAMIDKFMPKDECKIRCGECSKKFARSLWWQKVLVGSIITGTFTILIWLVEQIFKYHIAIISGG